MQNHQIETDLSKIQRLASFREDENFRFRTFLKGKDNAKTDEIVHRLHEELTRQIDCTLCGNCCFHLQPELHHDDMATLARLENIAPETYRDEYCEEVEIGAFFLKSKPCRYLEGKICRVYENRPDECKDFPYTGKEDFIHRTYSMIEFYGICPIVFNLMERLKKELQFSDKRYR